MFSAPSLLFVNKEIPILSATLTLAMLFTLHVRQPRAAAVRAVRSKETADATTHVGLRIPAVMLYQIDALVKTISPS